MIKIIFLLIGFVIAVIIDCVIFVINDSCLGYVILAAAMFVWEKFLKIFSPLWHPIISIWLIKNNHNPWHMTISEMLHVSDEEFEQWLKFIPKKYRKQWERMRTNKNGKVK